ncbi:carboxypeptidase-like regulatory domain-containing protein [Labilibaculum sp. DW002]|jgi:carboxypeptidase-like protein|uniref:Carboxypeptidase-like regulatory domain-containing protein n=1 Tax=Paralabilibaculum antarcticum TaxID=2912572 RepID=A0ABT5VLV5_9BACT|nr:carboxypeptidase-like regulatory domain-containing protein [Labilibaculum sp. DW002]MDE5416404.1 carboxypeptidase-like regulatory domain-containing protein [Labilibaculum sp. DW002]
MKTKIRYYLAVILSAFLLFSFTNSMAAEGTKKKKEKTKVQQVIDTLKYNVYKGKIQDKDTNEPLMFATITVKGVNVATVSNNEGEFLLKIAKDLPVSEIEVSYIGYKNLEYPINSLKAKRNILKLQSVSVPLGEINIYPMDPIFLVKSILAKVSENYAKNPNMMKGFYRETVKKNRTYVAISEAVVNIHKAGYRQLREDQVQIYKGRKSQDVKKMDTLLFKLQGGPTTSLLLDIVKNPYNLLSPDFITNYDFSIKSVTKINGKIHYVVEFKQKEDIDLPLYYGLLYIESTNLALASAKFSMNLSNETEASRMFIKRKPAGVKVTPSSADYLVNYHEKDGKWYFNYARGEVNFKCNWKRKLFNTNYSAMTEIAITDRNEENIIRFKGFEKFKSNQIMTEEVSNFADANFWGAYNTIEPDQSIESAIKKLKRKAR